ncbi:hypothetical protein V6N12_073555 [Hibiscus sabdariffa]|uniref:Uncharacterized protein n=1 Tax=Hibiscus sabdariffa TaxID=183260 RepID=A0ABR2BJE7_9ROSI
MGSKQDELYYFKEETVSIQAIIVDEETSSLALWHNGVLARALRQKTPSVLRVFLTTTVVKETPCIDASSLQHTSASTTGYEPRSFKMAMRDEGWRRAMQNEIKALEDNVTWTKEYLP